MAEVQTPNKETVERMFSAGAHFGYGKSRRHPSTQKYLFGTKNRVEIFDLEKTAVKLEEAKNFARTLGLEGKTLLLVAGKPEARAVIRRAAESAGLPYVASRWIGGTLTNFAEIKKRIERLETLRGQRERGELNKYTKRERLMIDRDITRLEEAFGGLTSLGEQLPHALFVIDTRREHIAVKEAGCMGLPMIGLSNSDCNLTEIDYPIPANDASLKSITYFVDEVVGAYRDGMTNAPVKKSEEKVSEREEALA
jgi:small subunit ribosomal protein S2